jgi:hypothetical protein
MGIVATVAWDLARLLRSENYILNGPPGAGSRAPHRIAHIEEEGRLPRGIADDLTEQARRRRAAPRASTDPRA